MRLQNQRSTRYFVNRRLGESKMNSSIFGEAIFGVMRLRLDSWTKKYPKKKN